MPKSRLGIWLGHKPRSQVSRVGRGDLPALWSHRVLDDMGSNPFFAVQRGSAIDERVKIVEIKSKE